MNGVIFSEIARNKYINDTGFENPSEEGVCAFTESLEAKIAGEEQQQSPTQTQWGCAAICGVSNHTTAIPYGIVKQKSCILPEIRDQDYDLEFSRNKIKIEIEIKNGGAGVAWNKWTAKHASARAKQHHQQPPQGDQLPGDCTCGASEFLLEGETPVKQPSWYIYSDYRVQFRVREISSCRSRPHTPWKLPSALSFPLFKGRKLQLNTDVGDLSQCFTFIHHIGIVNIPGAIYLFWAGEPVYLTSNLDPLPSPTNLYLLILFFLFYSNFLFIAPILI